MEGTTLAVLPSSGGFPFDLFTQISLQPDLPDELLLGFEPINVLIDVSHHVLKHVAGRVILNPGAVGDALAEKREHLLLRGQIGRELLWHSFANGHGAKPLHVRDTLEVEDVLDERFGILHFIDATLPDMVVESFITPVVTHFGVHKVLVDGSQIGCQDTV
jgi:hypothetical protein